MNHQTDPEIQSIIEAEGKRQEDGLTLIPSENHTSRDVLAALSSVFSDKYAEGYPGKRYYSGNEFADQLETLVIERAKQLFNVPYVNVQPYSGSPANFTVYLACLEPGDTFMGLDLLHGGHLTHGWKASATSRLWRSIPYHLTSDGHFDFEQIRKLAIEHKPKLIWCGGTAIPKAIPWKEFADIADRIGAYLVADISHIAGLVAGGAHESPVPYAHIVTTTTHKTLRGPRGALIMVTEKGLKKHEDLGSTIDKTIIPGFQGGPHLNTIAGIGIALNDASKNAFKDYANRIVENARELADTLMKSGLTLVGNGTDNHLLLLDLTSGGIGRGVFYQEALERIGIYTNKNTIPNDPSSPFYPSGLRLGTPAVTTRGMTTADMRQIASWINQTHQYIKEWQLPETKEERSTVLRDFRYSLEHEGFYKTLREEVRMLSNRYPIPGLQR